MANLRIAPINFHDDAVVTSDNVVATLPVSHTQNVARGLPYRSANATTPFAAIKGQWAGEVRRVSAFALNRHNLYGATVQLELFSNANWTGSTYDSTALATAAVVVGAYHWGYVPSGTNSQFDPLIAEAPFVHYFAPFDAKSYRLTVAGTLGAAYAEIGRAFLGSYLELACNPAPELTLGHATNSVQVPTLGGSLRTSDRARWRVLDLQLKQINEAQRPTLLDMMALCGLTRDVLVSVHPTQTNRLLRDYALLGKFTNLDAIARNNTWASKRVVLREI